MYLEYIRQMDESNFSPFFVEVPIAKLAYEICEGVTGVGTLQDRLAREFESKLGKAMTVDGQETSKKIIDIDNARLVRARLGQV